MKSIFDTVELTDEHLTAIYKSANGENEGKARPLTTQRIFAAMRAAYLAGRAECRKQALLEAADICSKESRKTVNPSEYELGYADSAADFEGGFRRMAEGGK